MSIEPKFPEPTPPVAAVPPAKGEYSKCRLTLLFLAFVPIFLLWTAFSVAAYIPAKIIGWARLESFVDECFAIWSLGLHYFFSNSYKFTPGEGRPILLVHGYLHNASGWYAMIDELKSAGFGPIYAIDLGDGTISGKFWSIHDYANQVAEKVNEIREQTGRDDIALVGHSMGGVVNSLYATQLAPQGSVTDLVMIGSPLRGSKLAGWLAEGADGFEMREDSKLLEEVRDGLEKHPEINVYTVASHVDDLVPFESALFGTDPKKQMVIEKGHATLMISRKVASQVVSWLKI